MGLSTNREYGVGVGHTRCRPEEDPQTTRHRAERHQEVRARRHKLRYSAADARIVSVDHQFFTRALPR